ncbi:MAG: hypothetical protein ABJC13_24330 [Acidobacteriota bacterium]
MSFFDRFRKNFSAPPPARDEAPSVTAEAPPGSFNCGSAPEGHKVLGYPPSLEPGLVRTSGQVLIANLGVAGDDSDRELEDLFLEVEIALREPREPAHLVNFNREVRIDELFAPANPPVLPFQSPIHWIFHQGSVSSILASPQRLQTFLRRLYEISAFKAPPISQAVYLVDAPTPATLAFARLLRGLDLEVRQPQDVPSALLFEVHRPEGPILTLMAGAPFPLEGDPADTFALKVNQEKDQAEAEGDQERLRVLGEQEREQLMKRTAEFVGSVQPLLRAPRFGRLLLEIESTQGEGTLPKLYEELAHREFPFLYMIDRETSQSQLRAFGPLRRALPIFADLHCLRWAAADTGNTSAKIVVIPPRELFAMAIDGDLGLAFNTFRNRATPVYVGLSTDIVRDLADRCRTLKEET